MRYVGNWVMLSTPTKGKVAGTVSQGAVVQINESDLIYISKLLQADAASQFNERGRWMSYYWQPRSNKLWSALQDVLSALRNDR